MRCRLVASLFPCWALAAASFAAPITDASALPGPTTTIDFSQFVGSITFTPGPVQVGALVGEDVVWTAVGASLIGDHPAYLFGSTNGLWTTGRAGYTATNSVNLSMSYTFNSGPVSGVGGFLNYFTPITGTSPTLEALDGLGNVLESWDFGALFPISTGGANDSGAFRGILRSQADIVTLRVSGSYIALDDLTFTRALAPVPEPASLGLVALGLVGAVARGRRSRRAVARQAEPLSGLD